MSGAKVPVRITAITAGKFRRYKHFRFIDYLTTPSVTLQNMVDLMKITVGFLQSLWIMLRFRPDVVFAKGGFVCLPVGWAARMLRIPVVIHDSDARPGLTNRLLAPFAHAIATGYPLENYPYDTDKTIYTGVPIRVECQPVDEARQKAAKKAYGLAAQRQLVVGFGGGLGAKSINAAIVESAKALESTQFIVVAGVKHYESTLDAAADLGNVQVLEFLANGMIELLSAADVVVTRASATALQELAGLKKPIIAVPARQLGDQHKNAEVYQTKGAAIILNDSELEQGDLTPQLQRILGDESVRNSLATHLHTFARPHAARDVATLILKTYSHK